MNQFPYIYNIIMSNKTYMQHIDWEELLTLEMIATKLWQYLELTDVHISDEYWSLKILSVIHKKNIEARLYVYDDIEVDKNGDIKVRIPNKDMHTILELAYPNFILIGDKKKKKVYYADLQFLSRVQYPHSDVGSTLIRVSTNFDLDKRATHQIADHIIEYNYDWKRLYDCYRMFVVSLNNTRLYLESDIDTQSDEFQDFYTDMIYIYKSLHVVNSKLDINKNLTNNKESILNCKKIINTNILGIQWLILDEKKYWMNIDIDFYTMVKGLSKI